MAEHCTLRAKVEKVILVFEFWKLLWTICLNRWNENGQQVKEKNEQKIYIALFYSDFLVSRKNTDEIVSL